MEHENCDSGNKNNNNYKHDYCANNVSNSNEILSAIDLLSLHKLFVLYVDFTNLFGTQKIKLFAFYKSEYHW